jgi:hypothetical protein
MTPFRLHAELNLITTRSYSSRVSNSYDLLYGELNPTLHPGPIPGRSSPRTQRAILRVSCAHTVWFPGSDIYSFIDYILSEENPPTVITTSYGDDEQTVSSIL